MAEKILGKKQQQKYNKLLKRQDQAAADAYKAKIAERKGISFTPTGNTQAPMDQTQAQQAVSQIDFNDPSSVIGGQYDVNQLIAQQNAQMNRPNEQGPYGSQTYEIGPDGQITLVRNLDQGQQQLLDQEVGLESTANQFAQQALGGANYSQPFSLEGAPKIPGQEDLMAMRSNVQDGIYRDLSRGLEDDYQQQREQMRQELIQSGNAPGSPKYDRLMGNFEDSFQENRDALRNQAYSLAGQEMDRTFNMGSDLRNRYIDESLLQRDRPLQEAGSLMSLGTGVRDPQFNAFQNVSMAPVDVAGTGLGFSSMFNSNEQAALDRQQQQKLQNQQIKSNQYIAGMNRGGGGGADGPDWLTRFQLTNQAQAERDARLAQLNSQNQGGGNQSSPWANIAAGIGSGIGTGIGASLF